MSTNTHTKARLGLWILLLGLLVVFRVSENFSSQVKEGEIEFVAQVSSPPYLKGNDLNFRAGKYSVKSDYLDLRLGDKVRVKGSAADGKVTASRIEKLPLPWWEERLKDLREELNSKIYTYFNDPQASLLSGVTLGLDQLPKDFKEELITTGTIHVVVVSGYNIALVGGFFLILAPYIGRRKASLLAILAIVCYTLLVGVSAPTLRAATLGVITLLGLLIGKRSLALYCLCLTGALMLILNPDYLIDISFQLSFLATLGILIFTQPFSRRLGKVHRLFRESIATTVAAQVLVLPVIFYYFGTISLISPLVNALVLWLIPLVTVGGFIYLAVSFIAGFAAPLIGLILLLPLSIFTLVVSEFSRLDFLLLTIPQKNWFLLIGYYLLLSSLVLNRLQKTYNFSKNEAAGEI